MSAIHVVTPGFLTTVQDLGRFGSDAELALFRVAQEALTNVHRHSGSRTVHLSVVVSDDTIILEIRDAGHGIQPAAQAGETGAPLISVGLAGMRERMRQLGGTVSVVSGPQGTCVRASLPRKGTKTAICSRN